MGIYDREYYRDEGSSFLGAFVRRGQVVKWLIIANVVAFVIQLATRTQAGPTVSGWFTDLFELDPGKVLQGQVWRVVTYGFLHDFGWAHILFNMLFLYWFGSELEDIYGSREFLGFYFAGLLLSGLAYLAFALVKGPVIGASPVFDADGMIVDLARKPFYPAALGASGAVTAVMVLFAMHFPTRTILLFFFLPVPVILLVVFNVLQDTIGLLGGSGRPVAFAAHLGGAAFGFLYYKFQWRVTSWLPSLSGLRLSRPRPRLKVYRGEPERGQRVVQPVPAAEPEEHLEAELDAVLEKVARLGRSSLTEREQSVLNKASEYYRQRRK
jgi:membrane associated rhomboid family serine protease